jgi:Domain of unknown function (DUF4384)
VPDAHVRDELTWAGPAANGASCMACHRSGPHGVTDIVRAQTETDTAAPRELRDQILALYPPQAEMDSLVAEDQERYAAAQLKAGIDPLLLINGLEPVAALAREHTRDVGLQRLAAEAELTASETRSRLAALPDELFAPARRILATTASRAEADRILLRLAPDAGGTEAAVVVAAELPPRPELELLLWSKSDAYEAGQLASFHARSNQNCYLTLISLDRSGQATVVFPNEFEQSNLLVAGKDMMLPAADASYQFRLRDKGRETLVGICHTSARPPDGIQHDFERQRFTMLGDWRAHMGQIPLPVTKTQSQGDPVKPRSARRSRGRQAASDSAQEQRNAVEQQVRTAITYDIR